MAAKERTYVFDTSAFAALHKTYPEKSSGVWEKIEGLIEAGLLVSVDEVYQEIQR